MQETITANQIEARFAAIFGYGWKSDLAEALGVSRETVVVQFSGNKVPGYMLAALEFLEVTPHRLWPARWDKLRERAKATAKKAAKKDIAA